jgi:hypothetical protein
MQLEKEAKLLVPGDAHNQCAHEACRQHRGLEAVESWVAEGRIR